MTDEKIVELFWKRSEAAIEETQKEYGRYVHYIAFTILQDDEDAREVANDTYLKAWNSIPPAKPNPLKAFLGRMTRQIALNHLEKQNAKKRGEGCHQALLDELLDCVSDSNGAEIVDSMVLKETLNRFLRATPSEERIVFIKRYWYAMPIADIARDCEISQSKVKSLLMRQRKKLKKYLKEEGFAV